MAQLELEADGDEPDPTIIGKVLERATDIAEDTVSDGLKSALKKPSTSRTGGTSSSLERGTRPVIAASRSATFS